MLKKATIALIVCAAVASAGKKKKKSTKAKVAKAPKAKKPRKPRKKVYVPPAAPAATLNQYCAEYSCAAGDKAIYDASGSYDCPAPNQLCQQCAGHFGESKCAAASEAIAAGAKRISDDCCYGCGDYQYCYAFGPESQCEAKPHEAVECPLESNDLFNQPVCIDEYKVKKGACKDDLVYDEWCCGSCGSMEKCCVPEKDLFTNPDDSCPSFSGIEMACAKDPGVSGCVNGDKWDNACCGGCEAGEECCLAEVDECPSKHDQQPICFHNLDIDDLDHFSCQGNRHYDVSCCDDCDDDDDHVCCIPNDDHPDCAADLDDNHKYGCFNEMDATKPLTCTLVGEIAKDPTCCAEQCAYKEVCCEVPIQ